MTEEKVRTNTRRDPLTDNAHFRLFEKCLKEPCLAPNSVTTMLGVSSFRVTNDEFLRTLKVELHLDEEVMVDGEISFITNRNLHYKPTVGPGNTIGNAHLTILVGKDIHQFTLKALEYVSTDQTSPTRFGRVIAELIKSKAFAIGIDL